MKLAFQLAYRNLIGAGLRTWLNAGILSFSFIVILFFDGLIDGWNKQGIRDSIDWEYGQGQLLHADYDPYDPFTIDDGHGKIPESERAASVPVLVRQVSVYPEGRMLSVKLSGIEAEQKLLKLPTGQLLKSEAEIPAVIGKRMAKVAQLKVGDRVLMRWRDKNGVFDAQEVTIAGVFSSNVPTVDQGQFWIPIRKLWQMTGLHEEVSYLIQKEPKAVSISGWNYKSQNELLKPFRELIKVERIGNSILFTLLLGIALLTLFDTQVLSIFRRQKEIGTYIALGMTRWQVVGLFTAEGAMYSLFAILLGSLYGIPFLFYMTKAGFGIPEANLQMGITIAERIYPVYGFSLIFGTVLLVVISATVVSFLPARKIARLDPVLAIKGKVL